MKKSTISIICTVISCVGTIGTAVMAVHETPETIRREDDRKLEIDPSGETELPWQEKAKIYAVGYWKTAAIAGVTIASSITSCAVSHSAYKQLLGVTAGVAAIGGRYKDKAVELFGEEKARLLSNAVNKEIKDDEFLTKKFWFHEPTSDQFFQSTLKDVYEAEYEANKRVTLEGYVCLGDIFPQIKKLSPKTSEWCWSQDMLVSDFGYPWIDFIHCRRNVMASEDGGIDWHFNEGRETYDINYGIYPMPPITIKEMGYMGPLDG